VLGAYNAARFLGSVARADVGDPATDPRVPVIIVHAQRRRGFTPARKRKSRSTGLPHDDTNVIMLLPTELAPESVNFPVQTSQVRSDNPKALGPIRIA